MIDLFVKGGSSPELELLIVDEAQDLTPLQWDQVTLMKNHSQEVWYAGDDDQCIFSWMGVRVDDFLSSSEHKEVLDKSYRLPKKIHSFADDMVKRLSVRQPKTWYPTEDKVISRTITVWMRSICPKDSGRYWPAPIT